MEQRTSDWLEWRRQGIGGSDAAIVMGVSPFGTLMTLWEDKTKRSKPFAGNWSTDRGNTFEPAARAYFETEFDLDFEPILAVHPEFPWVRASLDGWNAETQTVLEIKVPGAKDHALAKEGKVPEKYFPQLQHQMACVGGKKALYGSYNPDAPAGEKKGFVVEVMRDDAYIAEMIEKETHFWKEYVEKDVAPPLSDRDIKIVKTKDAVALFKEWKRLKLLVETTQEQMDKLKKVITEKYNKHARIECDGVYLTRFNRKGSIEYSKIPALKDVNLEQYRKPQTTVVELRLK